MDILHTILNAKAGKRIIALMLGVGSLFILTSTYIFTYRIPREDAQLLDIDGRITDGEQAFNQIQIMENMAFIPYNIRKIIDILPSPHSYSDVYQQFADEEAKAKRNVVVLLYWPDAPPAEVMKVLPDKNINFLESYKVQLLPQFMDRLNNLITARREAVEAKQSLLLWSTIFQMLGLIFVQCGLVLQALRK